MDNERLSAALEMVEQYRNEHPDSSGQPMSYTQAGKNIGVSGSILSSLRTGNYKGDSEKQVRIIEDYFAVKSHGAEVYREVDYAPTFVSETVYSVIKLCHIKGGLSMFAGDAGLSERYWGSPHSLSSLSGS